MLLRAVSLSPPVDDAQNEKQVKVTGVPGEHDKQTDKQQKTHEISEKGIRLGEILQRKCMSQKPQK